MAEVIDLELRKAFFIESAEILERMEGEIAALQAQPSSSELINSIFRSLHTIKGNSSFLSLEGITKLSHAAETLLDKARKKEIAVSPALFKIVGRVCADLKLMIVEQELTLDVKLPIQVIQKFMAGDLAAVDTLVDSAGSAGSADLAVAKVQTNAFVRVDENRISKILTLASELELLRYSFEKMPEKMDGLGPAASDLRFEIDMQVSKLSRLTRSLSSLVFGVRLVPVNQVFQRFPRVVADLAKKLGKEMRLQILNGEAELDKAIVEAITDPMTHLIRNSADHGIETIAERKKSTKPAVGLIKLNSYVRGNFVYIEIADDGRGIDGDKILKKAVEKGIVPADRAAAYTESQKLALIFAPGFSTADQVTDISGRGVGMDVVKSNINRLKGTVIIDSVVGQGTVIQLRFPMSMVVLFSLFMDIGGTACSIPVDQVDESIDYDLGELLPAVPAGESEDNYYKVYSLRRLMWGNGNGIVGTRTLHALRFKDKKAAPFLFVVDEFSSIEEAIVQSVDSYIAALPGLQGATVRKDGSVALVLNAQDITDRAYRLKPEAYVRRRSAFKEEPAELAA